MVTISTFYLQHHVPTRRPDDHGYPVPTPTYAYSLSDGNFNSYPTPARGVVSHMWRVPSINDRRDSSYDYAYKKQKHKQGKVEFPEFGLKDEIGKVGSEMLMNEITGSYGHKKDHNYSSKYGRSSVGYGGSMTRATNNIGTAVELLKDAATQVSGGGAKPSSRIGELESLVNYYPAMHTTMDAAKRYGSFCLAPRRSSMGEPNKYY